LEYQIFSLKNIKKRTLIRKNIKREIILKEYYLEKKVLNIFLQPSQLVKPVNMVSEK